MHTGTATEVRKCGFDRAALVAALDDCETASDTVQMIALMALRDPTWVEELLACFAESLIQIPKDTWRYRREVLSIDESVARRVNSWRQT